MTRRALPSAEAGWLGNVPEPTGPEYDGLCEVIRRHTGIHLNASKRALLQGRLLPRLRQLGVHSFASYLRLVLQDRVELEAMIDRITTNETRFFREPNQFDHLASRIVPAWRRAATAGHRSKRVRAWSAGCSTGEEPYSLAMLLRDLLPEHDGWTIEILATDISTRVLAVARQATWSIDRAGEIPGPLLRRFMLEGVGSQSGKMRAARELRDMVHVDKLNLNERAYAVGAPFDLVFCRNVLIYFGQDQRRRVVAHLTSHLLRGGHLFLGHAESIHGMPELTSEHATIYSKTDRGRECA